MQSGWAQMQHVTSGEVQKTFPLINIVCGPILRQFHYDELIQVMGLF